METIETVETEECVECSRLREAYRSATRHELDLEVMRDQATIRNDSALLERLRERVAEAALVRANASQGVLDHEIGHLAVAIAAAR